MELEAELTELEDDDYDPGIEGWNREEEIESVRRELAELKP
jgi:hypothetical protein